MTSTPATLLEQALQKETASGRDDFALAVRGAIGSSGELDTELGILGHLILNTESARQAYILANNGLLIVEWSDVAVFTTAIPLFRVIGVNTIDQYDEGGRYLGCSIMLDTGLRTFSSESGSFSEHNSMQIVARTDLRDEAEEFVVELRNALLGIWG